MYKSLKEYKRRFGSCGVNLINFLDFMLLFLENNNIRENCELMNDIHKYVMVKYITIHIKK